MPVVLVDRSRVACRSGASVIRRETVVRPSKTNSSDAQCVRLSDRLRLAAA